MDLGTSAAVAPADAVVDSLLDLPTLSVFLLIDLGSVMVLGTVWRSTACRGGATANAGSKTNVRANWMASKSMNGLRTSRRADALHADSSAAVVTGARAEPLPLPPPPPPPPRRSIDCARECDGYGNCDRDAERECAREWERSVAAPLRGEVGAPITAAAAAAAADEGEPDGGGCLRSAASALLLAVGG
jgi:hypothetical protein